MKELFKDIYFDPEFRNYDGCITRIIGLRIGLLICGIISMFISCKSVSRTEQHSEIATFRFDSSYVARWFWSMNDVENKCTITLNEKGDTVRVDNNRIERTSKARVDTIYINKTDTLYIYRYKTKKERVSVPYIPKWVWLTYAFIAFAIIIWVIRKKAHQH